MEIGFNLVVFFLNVFYLLKEVVVEVYCVLLVVVMDFYKLFKDDDFFCRIGVVFCYVIKIFFRDIEGVVCVLKYCKDDEYFLESFFGFLLLFIKDNCLYFFSER